MLNLDGFTNLDLIMRQFVLFSSFLMSVFLGFGQCPTTDITLATQAQIDNFAVNYPNCTMLTHELRIDGDDNSITNLNGLARITNAQDLYILKTRIQNFAGLSNLVTASQLSIAFNRDIVDLSGLISLETVGVLEVWVNNSITSLAGIDGLKSLEHLNLFINPNLEDISQLNPVESLKSLSITGNALKTLSGLENLRTVDEDFYVADEPLQSFNELASLQSIGGSLYLWNHTLLEDLSIFNNIQTLTDLYVIGCPVLKSLSGLENVRSVSGKLRIGLNPELTDLSIFSNVTSVGSLDIYENNILQNLSGLENLQSITDRLFIHENDVLNSISALRDLSTSEISEVVIAENPNLSTCSNRFICTVIEDPNVVKIINNNSTGCNSVTEIGDACLLSVSEVVLDSLVAIYPNPVSEILNLSVYEGLLFKKATLYSALGQKVLASPEKSIDVSSLSEGIYFLEITTDKGNLSKKIVKN